MGITEVSTTLGIHDSVMRRGMKRGIVSKAGSEQKAVFVASRGWLSSFYERWELTIRKKTHHQTYNPNETEEIDNFRKE